MVSSLHPAVLCIFLLVRSNVNVNADANAHVNVAVNGKLSSWSKVRRVKAGKVYEEHEAVHIVVNKVGPFNNPTETYRYYSLPFCQSHSSQKEEDIAAEVENIKLGVRREDEKREAAIRQHQSLGESIAGDRRETSPYEITFQDSVQWRLLCKATLDTPELEKLKKAITNNYFFEMFVEDLPMWGYIGDIADEDFIADKVEGTGSVYLFPHVHFHLGYNNSNIVSAKVTTDIDRRVEITDTSQPINIQFSYSVEWDEDELEWKNRMSRFDYSSFFPSTFEIHKLSMIYSFVLVLFVTAFLTFIRLRFLKNDFSRNMELDDETVDEELSGWKLIHGDVFRFPQYSTLFCAVIGTGNQLICTTVGNLGLALTGVISTNRRGSIIAGVIVLYCLTSSVAGFSSVKLYRQMNGERWDRCILLTALLFPVPVVSVFFWVNSVALLHSSTSALPFTAILTVLALFCFLCLPLTVLGGIVAKNYANPDFNAPTCTTMVAREIPTGRSFYRGRMFQVLFAGFLPFSAIYIELFYIFASMWGHQIYTLFGIFLLTFILLVIVTSFVTVALLYFQLVREDHRWWWASYFNGGMTGILIYVYSFYYYYRLSGMSGILQASFYFGYMAVVSFAFFLMLGAAAFQFCLVFVKYIYSRVKFD